jgi:hypothetical protein
MSASDLEAEEVLVKKRARVILTTWIAVSLFVLWMLISSALDMWSAWEAHNARETLLDCVTPAGQCYQDGQSRTATAVDELMKDGIERETVTRATIIASVWCDKQPNVIGLEELEACVKQQLALRERDRGDQ